MGELVFKDIYEPTKFQMINIHDEKFDCETIFRTVEDNLKLEELSSFEYEDGKLKGEKYNKRALLMAVLYCGKDEAFWKQFSSDALNKMITELSKREKEKYKKKQEEK
jgi:hypothetical protein